MKKLSIFLSFALLALVFAPADAFAATKRFRFVQTWNQRYIEGWAQDRINQNTFNLDKKTVAGSGMGVGITVYVIDTGVGAGDCHGHGTVVASMIAGSRYGIASGASIVGVKALDCAGYGTDSDVINAVNWVYDNANPSTSVVNMSLGGSIAPAVDAAVARLAARIPVVVAAGNSSADACNATPARVPAAITIAAYDQNNLRSIFSNYGPCVDFWVPGTAVDGVDRNGNRVQWSGTSMATALASGAIAYVADRDNITTMQAVSVIKAQASRPYIIDAHLFGVAAYAIWIRN